MSRMTPATIVSRLSQRLFGSQVLRNDIRGELVEEIVAVALEPAWQLCSTDWAACDLIQPTTGLRIQVKQSAALQSWDRAPPRQRNARFSIAEKTGRWDDGNRWIAEPSRNADIFIFGWHPLTDSSADHRDPTQWMFYVVHEADLPKQRSISLKGLQSLSEGVPIELLSHAVEAASTR